LRQSGRGRPRKDDAGSVLGDEPEVEGLVERGEVLVDIVAAGQMVEGIVEQGTVFGQSEGFDVAEGLAQRGAESAGGAELGGQAGTELFVGEASGEDIGGFRWEAVFHVFQETLQDVAVDMGKECGVDEELEGFCIHFRFSIFDFGLGENGFSIFEF